MDISGRRPAATVTGPRGALPSGVAVGVLLSGVAILSIWSRGREETASPFLNIEIVREVASPEFIPRAVYLSVMSVLIVSVAILNRGRERPPSALVPIAAGASVALPLLSIELVSVRGLLFAALLGVVVQWSLGTDGLRRRIALAGLGMVLLEWFVTGVVIPGVDPVIVVEKASLFVVFQEHYGGTVMSGLDAFSPSGIYLPAGYGHLGAVVGVLGLLVDGASLVQLVWLGHVLFLFLLCTGALQLVPVRRAVMLLAVMVLAVPGDLLSASPGMHTPNLSGLRYLVAMSGIVILIRFARSRSHRWAGLGAVLGSLAALTLDGGLVLLAAMSVMAALVREGAHESVLEMLRRVSVSISAFLISGLLVSVALARWLSPGAVSVLQILDFAGGRGGHVAPLDPRAALLFIVAAVILIVAAWASRPGGHLIPLAAGLAFASLVQWFTFVNRMLPSQLGFVVVLIGLAIAAVIAGSGADAAGPVVGRPSRVAVLSGMGALVVCAAATTAPLQILDRPESCRGERRLAAGYCLEGEWVGDLAAMVEVLEGQPVDSRAVLSSAPVLVRELGFNDSLPYSRGVFASVAWEDLAGASIAAPWVEAVLVQSPESVLGAANPVATGAFEDIVSSSGVFDYSRSEGGWSVYLRRGSVLPLSGTDRPPVSTTVRGGNR